MTSTFNSQNTRPVTLDGNDLVTGILQQKSLILYRENNPTNTFSKIYYITNLANQIIAHIIPDYSNAPHNGARLLYLRMQDPLGRVLLVFGKHPSGVTTVYVPRPNNANSLQYIGCCESYQSHHLIDHNLKAFSHSSGSSLETFAHVRETNGQLHIVNSHGSTGARITPMPYEITNPRGQVVSIDGCSISHSYKITMNTSNFDSALKSPNSSASFIIGITQRAMVIAQILSMDLDGYILQRQSKHAPKSGLLDPNKIMGVDKSSVQQPVLLSPGQNNLSHPMNGFSSYYYPATQIVPRDLYTPQGYYNQTPFHINNAHQYFNYPSFQ